MHTGRHHLKLIHFAIKISINHITIYFSYYVHLITMIDHWLSMSWLTLFIWAIALYANHHLPFRSHWERLSSWLVVFSYFIIFLYMFFSTTNFKHVSFDVSFFFNKHWQKSPLIDMTCFFIYLKNFSFPNRNVQFCHIYLRRFFSVN